MKNLFILMLVMGLFPGSFVLLSAQNNVNPGRASAHDKHSISLKFINGIEITPQVFPNTTAPVEEKLKLYSIANPNSKVSLASPEKNIESCTHFQFKFAMLMDREVESIKNLPLFSFINEWWAIRYRYGGSDQNGIDCSSFTEKLLSKVYGFSVPRTSTDQFLLCNKVATSNLVEGDLVFFNTRSTRRRRKGITHVGLYLGNNYFVHSSVQDGVTISSLTDEYYSNKFISGGRISNTH
jgi:lipoprotein Spr